MHNEIQQYKKYDRETLWQVFKKKYQEITGEKIDYDLSDIEKFAEACIKNDSFKDVIDMYNDFSVTWLAANIMSIINKIVSKINEIDAIEQMDIKSQFVVFDRLIKQLKDLVNIREKMRDFTTNENKNNTGKINIDKNKLLI